jgi:hypothetical protein
MKTLLTAILLTFAAVVEAQQAGVYQLLTGGTNTTIPANTTNEWLYSSQFGTQTNFIGLPGTASNLVTVVSEYQDVGFTWSFTGTNSTTGGAVNLKVWQCYDDVNNVWATSPTWTFSATPTGNGTYATNCDLYVPGATRLAFTVENGASGPLNNALLEVNLKLPKRGALPASQ